MSEQKPNRVWMELDRPENDEQGHARAAALTRLLAKLGFQPRKGGETVWWWPEKGRYCFTLDEAGGFVEAGDNGHWFNLDYLSRE